MKTWHLGLKKQKKQKNNPGGYNNNCEQNRETEFGFVLVHDESLVFFFFQVCLRCWVQSLCFNELFLFTSAELRHKLIQTQRQQLEKSRVWTRTFSHLRVISVCERTSTPGPGRTRLFSETQTFLTGRRRTHSAALAPYFNHVSVVGDRRRLNTKTSPSHRLYRVQLSSRTRDWGRPHHDDLATWRQRPQVRSSASDWPLSDRLLNRAAFRDTRVRACFSVWV